MEFDFKQVLDAIEKPYKPRELTEEERRQQVEEDWQDRMGCDEEMQELRGDDEDA